MGPTWLRILRWAYFGALRVFGLSARPTLGTSVGASVSVSASVTVGASATVSASACGVHFVVAHAVVGGCW